MGYVFIPITSNTQFLLVNIQNSLLCYFETYYGLLLTTAASCGPERGLAPPVTAHLSPSSTPSPLQSRLAPTLLSTFVRSNVLDLTHQ